MARLLESQNEKVFGDIVGFAKLSHGDRGMYGSFFFSFFPWTNI